MKEEMNLYEKVKKRILEDIQVLEADQRIPSRIQLAKKYGVTRTTIERAISELVGEGYLYAKDGSGTYISGSFSNKGNDSSNQNVKRWGVILPNILEDTYPGILRGIEDVASQHSIVTQVCNHDNDPDKQNHYIQNMLNVGIDGIVLVPSIIEDGNVSVFKWMEEKEIPFVACNRSIASIQSPKVISNSYHGGYLATKHLIEQGYQNIAYIASLSYSISIERYQGYLAAITDFGLTPNEEFVHFEEYSPSSIKFDKVNKIGYQNVKEMLSKDNRPDAFFCFDDLIAQGAYYAISESGFQVGTEIGLVGYNDNYYICNSLPGALTSIDFKAYEVGNTAANLLLDMMSGKKVSKSKTIVIQPEMKVRGSSQRLVPIPLREQNI
ncbi:GntR family transcriptional regulator [Neobacillus sedimentimangrovi]|uniref:GntR family transcriptional regulator n=1 Tax=Neobacillus sedimentimangrovi TaxID=2699460 RepID=UPI0013D63621|nr:GntR family transcriptional regulator [Neobacillus sedimentimangrovi]